MTDQAHDPHVLNPCLLTGSGLARASRLKRKYRPEGYDDALDRDTLWYDAIWSEGRVHLICPPFNNLAPVMRQARWVLDGTPVKPARIRRYNRHTIVELPAKGVANDVSVSLNNWTGRSAVSRTDHGLFARLNTAICISKDNDLTWIRDFIRFHQHHHGLQAMIVVDNGSTAYSLQDLRTALAETGLERTLALSAPFPYGPRGRKPYARAEKFLQTAVFNILRLRYVGRARAVLNCDIDELMWTPGTTVFDLARQSRFGYVRLPGHWRFSRTDLPQADRHMAHVYRRPESPGCPPKWCLVPDGPFRRFSWDTHRLEGLGVNGLFLSNKGHFWHCFNVSTAWKKSRQDPPDTHLWDDPESAAALAPVFGPAPRPD